MQKSVGCYRIQAYHLAVSILYIPKYSHHCILEERQFKCINKGCVCGLRLKRPITITQV